MTELKNIRAKIDEIDEQIQALINERAECAQKVASLKRSAKSDNHFYRPEREAQILRKVKQTNPGPLDAEKVAHIFREIMSACLALENPLTIGYLGPAGTFTELAALKHFGTAVNTKPLTVIDDVFREVEAGAVSYGVVPVENSTEGVVSHTLDMFLNSPLKICGEILVRVHHNLVSQAKDIKDITEIVAHQQSLAQCREWLDTNLPGVSRTMVSSNAAAAKLAQENPSLAALGSEHAAELYGLSVLAANIEDEPDNTTRFLVIGKQSVPPSGKDKTSLMVAAKNQSGALYNLLAPLANNECSMTRIESRPSRRATWEYVFFIDIEGHAEERSMQRAIRALEKESASLKILGSYPTAVL